jgi:hypothetical protein
MNYRFQFDTPTAVRVAELLEQDGNLDAAAQVWWQLCALDPYDRRARERVGDLAYEVHRATMPPPGVERSRMLLKIIGLSFPTAKLTGLYFESLRAALAGRPRRAEPGKLVIALGTGRCGTTTFASMLAGPDACATHENPPGVYWQPVEEQLRFHVERFRLLLEYFAVVCDASYWWLNARGRLWAEFPEAKLVGLVRETQSCVESFMKQKGFGAGSLNHWAPAGSGIWRTAPLDPCLPKYAVPETAAADPDGAKRAMIARYVSDYNKELAAIAAADPQRMLIVRMEELGEPASCARIGGFLGLALAPRAALNVGTTADGDQLQWNF